MIKMHFADGPKQGKQYQHVGDEIPTRVKVPIILDEISLLTPEAPIAIDSAEYVLMAAYDRDDGTNFVATYRYVR